MSNESGRLCSDGVSCLQSRTFVVGAEWELMLPRFYRAMEQESSIFLQASLLSKSVALHELRVMVGLESLRFALDVVDLLNPDVLSGV